MKKKPANGKRKSKINRFHAAGYGVLIGATTLRALKLIDDTALGGYLTMATVLLIKE